MDYHNFGYVVDSCPINLTEQRAAASRLKCGVDKFGNSQYLCVPNFTNTAIVEYCYNGTVGLHKKGSCLVVNNDGIVDIVSCHSFTEGCTTDFFKSSDLYQYPACHQIDTEARCFSADPTCQKTDPEITRNVSFVTSNTISSEFTTTLNYTNSTKNTEYGQISAVAIAFISIAFILVILGILFIGYRCLRSRKKKRKQKKTVASGKDPFVLEENVKLRDIERDDEEKFRIEPEHNRVGISRNAKRDRTDELRDKINESNNEEEPLIHREGDVGLGKVEGTNTVEDGLSMTEENLTEDTYSYDIYPTSKEIWNKEIVGDYRLWKTCISDQFFILTDDEVSVLFCFLCSDSGPPDFTDTEWLDMLNEIRLRVYDKGDPVTSEEAQQTLDILKSRDFLWEDQDKMKEDIKDETMYKIASIDGDIPFYYSSYDTASVYLRSMRYSRKPGEKCVSGYSFCDFLLIRRLQMNILTHVTMEDRTIFDEIYQILNVPKAISQGSHSERDKFLSDQKQEGEAVHYKGRSQDSVQHVTWLWRYGLWARPDIVRSCIGLHPHNDIYIIDNKAYRKPSECHKYTSDVRSLLYCLLLVDDYTVNISEDSHKITLSQIRDRYFKEDAMSNDIDTTDLPEEIIRREDNKIMFTSDSTRHNVMYAFVTECLVEESDLKFFLTTASGHVISEYCRYWDYKRSEEERCMYLPYYSREMENLFLNKLQLDIIAHCSVLDKKICDTIIRRFGVPEEILKWDKEARKRYVEYAKRGTQTVHHARGMIVGCAGAGKTTLLKRLLRCSEEEIRNVKSTEGLEVHEEIFQICDETKTLKATPDRKADGTHEMSGIIQGKRLSFFDFGGQCAYYACHQIYLTRRAFYIVVVDASKSLNESVDEKVCDQKDSVFSGWKYGDYFVFWIKSIHTYCVTGSDSHYNPVILIVATHWEKEDMNEEEFINSLHGCFPGNSDLPQYVKRDNCFYTGFPLKPLADLEKCIIDIVSQTRWTENIPKEWAFFEIEINQKKSSQRIIQKREIHSLSGEGTEDMLRFYHDSGKVLYFKENGLEESVILDVQWFIDAFKKIVLDKLHFEGIAGSRDDWKEYYNTGILTMSLLRNIWAHADNVSYKELSKDQRKKLDFGGNRRDILYHENTLLRIMQRLGLMALCHTEKVIYVPCMNRRKPDESHCIIQMSGDKSSILIFQFDFLPYFLFFRLVVACMQHRPWKALKSGGTFCLFKNVALFSSDDHHFAIGVTASSIQLQVYQPHQGKSVDGSKTYIIQERVESLMHDLIGVYQKKLMFKRGFSCKEGIKQFLTMNIDGHFIPEKDMPNGDGEVCPLHQGTNLHYINANMLKRFWKLG